MGQYDNRFGNYTIGVTNFSYVSIALTAANSPLQLYWPDQAVDSAVANPTTLASWIDVTADDDGFSVKMPDARLASPGQIMDFNNYGANHDINIYKQDGTTLISILPRTQLARLVLIDNSTANGSWRVAPINGLATAVTQITQTSDTANIVITPTGAQAGAVSYHFNVGADLLALTSFAASTGIATRIAANTWALRTITGTNNQIAVQFGNGVGGNPTISLPTTITGINDLTVGNLNLATNTISSINANGNINFAPLGTGFATFSSNVKLLQGSHLYFRNPNNTFDTTLTAGAQTANIAYTWPTSPPAAGQALVSDVTGQWSWANVSTSTGGGTTQHAIARYFDTTGKLENSLVLLDDAGNVTDMTSLIVGSLQLGLGGATNISTVTGNLLLSPNGSSETYSSNNLNVRSGSLLKLSEATNTNFVSFKAGASTATQNYTLPLLQGASGDVFAVTDGSGNLSPATIPGRNRLVNGDFSVWQAGTTFTSTGAVVTPTADCWATKTAGGLSVTVSRTAGVNNATFLAKVQRVAANTDTNPVLFSQTLPANFCVGMSGNKAVYSFWLKVGANFSGANITATIYSGKDTSDVGFLTAGAFTSQVTEGTVTFVPTTTLTKYTLTTNAAVQTGATQLAVLFTYTPVGTAGADDSFYVTDCQLEQGVSATAFERLPFSEQLSNCEYFYSKSFKYDTAPAQNIGKNTAEFIYIAYVAGAQALSSSAIFFKESMRVTPTIILYNPAAANGAIRDESANQDLTGSSSYNVNENSFFVNGTGHASTTVGGVLGVHYTADARLS